MTTVATKPVRRITAATVYSAGRRRAVIVTIRPDGLIGLRLFGQRREETLCADVMYAQAVVERVVYEKRMKKKAKKEGKVWKP